MLRQRKLWYLLAVGVDADDGDTSSLWTFNQHQQQWRPENGRQNY